MNWKENQIDWIKEKEEEEELIDWLEDDKSDMFRPITHSPYQWWKKIPITKDKMEEIKERGENILYKKLMKKLNR